MIDVKFYTPSNQASWDAAVQRSRASSFLFQRAFMDYHSDRFRDRSLMAFDEKGSLLAVLPAAETLDHSRVVVSHGGLTYGGILTDGTMTTARIGEVFDAALCAYSQAGYERLVYKAVPHIYHLYPSEEDLYWLFRHSAHLVSRAVSSVIDLTCSYGLSKLRQRKVKRAARENLTFRDDKECLSPYWQILTDVLSGRHGVKPVHSLEEIGRLMQTFPQEITLHTVWRGETILAGCLLFRTSTVVHVQYIAATNEGRAVSALDILFDRLIKEASEKAVSHYFDFGISTEQGGLVLNEGLIFQKEGFGARAVCYDTYEITLQN